MMKAMREQGVDPSQLGGMPGISGGLPGMSPADLEAMMGGSGQPLTRLNPRKTKKEKQPGQQKKQRPARSKRRR
jgi:hypothetical protein